MRLTNIIISAGVAMAAGFGAYATFGTPGPAPQQSPRQAGDGDAAQTVTFYGAMEDSYSWGQSRKVGIYSFDAGEGTPFKEEGMIRDSRLATGGGAYVDGKFYYINGIQTSDPARIQNTFNTVDTDTWQVVGTTGHTAPTLTDAYCLAYDHSTSTMYAYSRAYEQSNPERRYALRKVNLETGEFTHVAYIDGNYFVPAMAFDRNGQLYGMERRENQFNARLLKIDKQTGATQVVGADLGFISGNEYAGAVFDYRDGGLYIASVSFTVNPDQTRNYSSHLYKVDVATGVAESVKAFDGNEVFSCLFIKDSHPLAPAGVDDLGFSYNNDTRGRVTFTIPVERYDRTALTGAVKAEIWLNGALSQTLEGKNPGEAAQSSVVRLEEGKANKVKVYCIDSEGHRSVAVSRDVWGGKDVPAAPGDITLTAPADGASCTVTWTAPEVSANGGRCDLSDLTYKVVRRPEMETVAEGLTETRFTDVPDRKMGVTQYDICAVSANGEGVVAHSKTIVVGRPHAIRYRESFDDVTGFLSYTTVSVNGLASPNGNAWMYYPQNKSAVYWLDYDAMGPADAWLITPTLALETDKVYRLDFDTRGFASSEITYQTLTASVGDAATQEGMKREFFRMEGETPKTSTSYHGFFVADESDNRVGFHLTNQGRDHCQIDNIIISEYGPSTIPAAPEIVSTGTDDRKAVITVKAPATDTRGRDMASLTAVTLYRVGSTRAVKTVGNPAPGENLVIVDEEAVFGMNDYYITASNADGQGLETNVSVNTRASLPVAVESLEARTVNDSRDVELRWSYPAGYPAADGTTLRPEEISYDIYRSDGMARVPVAKDVRATEFTHKSVMELFPGRKQARVQYYVVPVTSGGQAEETGVAVSVGDAYDLPVAESNFYEMSTGPWVSTPSSAWQPGECGWLGNTRIDPCEGYTLMRAGVNGNWLSPRFNLTSRHNPVLTFMLYCGTQGADTQVEVGVVREADGVELPIEMIPGAFTCQADEDGWKMMTVDLSAYGDCGRASIVFKGGRGGQFPLLVDDIRIDGTKLAYDPRVASLEGPSNCVRGRSNIYVANLRNNGTGDMAGVTVRFLADGKEIASETVDIAGEATGTVEFTFVPELNGADDEPLEISAVLEAGADGETFESRVARLVTLVVPNVPYVNDLAGAYDQESNCVRLTWSEAKQYPRAFPVKDDFESYEDWIIDGIGDWKLVDADEGVTIGGIYNSQSGITYTWPNVGSPQAYIVFNPGRAYVKDLCSAYSGEKCLVAFSSAARNDDWLISPQLLGAGQTISFQARALNPGYTRETYEVLYSTSGSNPEDFIELKKETVRSSEWSRMEYVLPDGARYFAIRCTSDNQFGLMLDDIEYIPAQQTVTLYGYRLYRNGETLVEEIGETEYADSDVNEGDTHEYRVSAIYDDGESIHSEPVTVDIRPGSVGGLASDGIRVAARESRVVVDGAQGLPVSVYDAEGRMLYRIVSTGRDVLEVGGGVHIVSVGDRSYKLLVK